MRYSRKNDNLDCSTRYLGLGCLRWDLGGNDCAWETSHVNRALNGVSGSFRVLWIGLDELRPIDALVVLFRPLYWSFEWSWRLTSWQISDLHFFHWSVAMFWILHSDTFRPQNSIWFPKYSRWGANSFWRGPACLVQTQSTSNWIFNFSRSGVYFSSNLSFYEHCQQTRLSMDHKVNQLIQFDNRSVSPPFASLYPPTQAPVPRCSIFFRKNKCIFQILKHGSPFIIAMRVQTVLIADIQSRNRRNLRGMSSARASNGRPYSQFGLYRFLLHSRLIVALASSVLCYRCNRLILHANRVSSIVGNPWWLRSESILRFSQQFNALRPCQIQGFGYHEWFRWQPGQRRNLRSAGWIRLSRHQRTISVRTKSIVNSWERFLPAATVSASYRTRGDSFQLTIESDWMTTWEIVPKFALTTKSIISLARIMPAYWSDLFSCFAARASAESHGMTC